MTFPTPTLTKEASCAPSRTLPVTSPWSPNKENSFSEGKSKDLGPFRPGTGSRGASRRVVAAFSFAPVSNFATRLISPKTPKIAFHR